MTTSWENEKTGITVLTRRARSEAREEGLSEERSQAKQTNILRARWPRGLEFHCGPAPKPHTGKSQSKKLAAGAERKKRDTYV